MMRSRGVLLMGFLLCLGCSSPRQSSESNPALVGYSLIDRGQADLAVQHFQVLLQDSPESDEYRRGLSAAYALKGGFKIQNLVGPMIQIRETDASKDNFKETLEKLGVGRGDSKHAQISVAFQLEVVLFLRKFQSVPNLNRQEAPFLKTAISILLNLKNPDAGDSLYMAVLESLLLKFELMQPLAAHGCDEVVLALQRRALNSAGQFGKILNLLSKAQPSQAEKYEKQMVTINGFAAEIANLSQASLMALMAAPSTTGEESRIRIFEIPPECRL